MDATEFRKFGKAAVDYLADYLENLRDRSVPLQSLRSSTRLMLRQGEFKLTLALVYNLIRTSIFNGSINRKQSRNKKFILTRWR